MKRALAPLSADFETPRSKHLSNTLLTQGDAYAATTRSAFCITV
jgi:hypothetical protein